MVYICMRTRKTPPQPIHTKRERERDGEKERGPTRFVCWMRATELKIVGERERERERERAGVRERGRSCFMHQRLI